MILAWRSNMSRRPLARYDEDGLSFQRYLRKSQRGEGDDILAGNCMAIVGLYRDIYGIQPKPNRLYLDPHLTDELNGTKLRYQLRGRLYGIESEHRRLRDNRRSLHPARFASLWCQCHRRGTGILSGHEHDWAMSISRPTAQPLMVQIESWPNNPDAARQWTETSPLAKGKTLHISDPIAAQRDLQTESSRSNRRFLTGGRTGRIQFPTNVVMPRRKDLSFVWQPNRLGDCQIIQ